MIDAARSKKSTEGQEELDDAHLADNMEEGCGEEEEEKDEEVGESSLWPRLQSQVE